MYSRLTHQYRAAIPREMRELLQIEPGDVVKHEIVDGRILLSKATANEIGSWVNVKINKKAKAKEKTKTKTKTEAKTEAKAHVNAIAKRTPRFKVRETYGSYGKL